MPASGPAASELWLELGGEGPASLRQTIHSWVATSGDPPLLYWAVGLGLLLLLAALAMAAVVPEGGAPSRRARLVRFLRRPTLFAAILALAFFALRWPGLARPELNPDESQAIASAMKLTADPVFWRAVDGTTHGPLNYYPLLLVRPFGLHLDYGSARLVGLAALAAALVLFYLSARRLFGEATARLVVLPPAACLALFTQPEFIHYTSEQVPVLLVSAGLYRLCCLLAGGPAAARAPALFGLGLLLGAIPFAKLQAVPIGFALALIALAEIVRRRAEWPRSGAVSRMGALLAGGVTAPLAALLAVLGFGIFEHFWRSYILANLFYAARVEVPLLGKLARLPEAIFWTHEISEYLTGALLFTFLGLASLVLWRALDPRRRRLLAASLVLLLGAAVAVAQPGNFFPHYLLLLVLPAAFASAVVLEALLAIVRLTPEADVRRALVACVLTLFLGSALVYPMTRRLAAGNEIFAATGPRNAVIESQVGRLVLAHAAPGETLAVWGWRPRLYVETGLIPATRDTVSQYQIIRHPQQEYYRKRYAKDLASALPPVFVDAVGPWQPAFWHREAQGHDADPLIAPIVADRYRLVADVDNYRVYVRRDRLRAGARVGAGTRD